MGFDFLGLPCTCKINDKIASPGVMCFHSESDYAGSYNMEHLLKEEAARYRRGHDKRP